MKHKKIETMQFNNNNEKKTKKNIETISYIKICFKNKNDKILC